jgi:hypothetical protein
LKIEAKLLAVGEGGIEELVTRSFRPVRILED